MAKNNDEVVDVLDEIATSLKTMEVLMKMLYDQLGEIAKQLSHMR
ncbi:hypothetical protein [Anaerosolibacter sp.]